MHECMNEGRLNYRLISMCVCIYVSLLHDSASGGARTALAPCLETWLAPWPAPRYGSRQPTLYLLAMILLLLLVGSLQVSSTGKLITLVGLVDQHPVVVMVDSG